MCATAAVSRTLLRALEDTSIIFGHRFNRFAIVKDPHGRTRFAAHINPISLLVVHR